VIDSGDFTIDRSQLGDWYDRHYAGARRLVFEGMHEFYRRYGWS